jgi:hypothetical protein
VAQPSARASKPKKARLKKDKLCTDDDLGLCVLEAMVRQKLVKTKLRVPGLEPDDEDDLDDESESWRDSIGNNQTEPIRELLALLSQHRDKVASVNEIDGVLMEIADTSGEPYEVALHSLAGIEACTALEKLSIWTDDPGLDLSPLVSLRVMKELDLACAGRLRDLRPLLEMKTLKKVVGDVDTRTASLLKAKGVKVAKK